MPVGVGNRRQRFFNAQGCGTSAAEGVVMKSFLAVFALVGFLIPLSGRAATVNVTSTADSGAGSLRDAIAAASSGDTINISVTGTITLTGAPLTIDKSLAISGPGASELAVSGNKAVQVFVVNSGATVTISGLTIENGAASGGGGGISNSGMLTVTDSVIAGNTTDSFGGGILNLGMLTVANSTVSGNSASCCNGGGISNLGMLTVTNSTVAGNSVAFFYGGGIYNMHTLNMTNDTLSGNTAGFHGGGIANFGTMTVKNTILANSLKSGNCYMGNGGVIDSRGHNLSDDASCTTWLTGTGDQDGIATGLDSAGLKNNGGPTWTIALSPGGAAVDAIPISPTNYCTLTDGITPVATDQRGVARPGGSACDIGAFELVQTTTVTIDIKPGEGPAPINTKSKGTIPVAVLSNSTFDAVTQVDQTSLTFGHTGSEKSLAFCSGPQDVNGDGLLDLVCHFNTPLTQFQAGDTKGVLKGKILSGNTIMGSDAVVVLH
jgi:hypothetical protein